jgi:hypothetical protein
VYQKNYEWFVSTSNGEVPFNNGIKLDWIQMTKVFSLLSTFSDDELDVLSDQQIALLILHFFSKWLIQS